MVATEVDTSTYGGTSRSGVISTLVATVATGANQTETDLFTYTFPASAFTSSSAVIRLRFWYVTGANANLKTVKVYFGGTVVASRAVADNALTWDWVTNIMRVTTNSQVAFTTRSTSTAGAVEIGTAAITESTAIILKVTGQNGASVASDISFRGAVLEFLQ